MGLSSRPDLDAVAALTIFDWWASGRSRPANRERTPAVDDLEAERFFADRGFRLEFSVIQKHSRDYIYSYTWVDLIPAGSPTGVIPRYAGGNGRPEAAAHSVARWHVEQGE